jgi:hypothetical protein
MGTEMTKMEVVVAHFEVLPQIFLERLKISVVVNLRSILILAAKTEALRELQLTSKVSECVCCYGVCTDCSGIFLHI